MKRKTWHHDKKTSKMNDTTQNQDGQQDGEQSLQEEKKKGQWINFFSDLNHLKDVKEILSLYEQYEARDSSQLLGVLVKLRKKEEHHGNHGDHQDNKDGVLPRFIMCFVTWVNALNPLMGYNLHFLGADSVATCKEIFVKSHLFVEGAPEVVAVFTPHESKFPCLIYVAESAEPPTADSLAATGASAAEASDTEKGERKIDLPDRMPDPTDEDGRCTFHSGLVWCRTVNRVGFNKCVHHVNGTQPKYLKVVLRTPSRTRKALKKYKPLIQASHQIIECKASCIIC